MNVEVHISTGLGVQVTPGVTNAVSYSYLEQNYYPLNNPNRYVTNDTLSGLSEISGDFFLVATGNLSMVINNQTIYLSGNMSNMGAIYHGTNNALVRPLNYDIVTWIGSIEPLNAIDNDIWIDIT